MIDKDKPALGAEIIDAASIEAAAVRWLTNARLDFGIRAVGIKETEIFDAGAQWAITELQALIKQKERAAWDAGNDNITKYGEQIATFEDYQASRKVDVNDFGEPRK